jgi:uncharacterized protein (TIGR00369 family)
MEEIQAIRSVTLEWQSPSPAHPEEHDLSGLNLLRGWRDGSLVMPPIGQVLGVRIGDVEHGRVHLEIPLRDFMTNHWGVVLGGMVATALDTALGCAVISVLPAGRDMAALDLNVQFLRAVRYRDMSVRVEATCMHFGRDRALAEARLTTTDERLCAFATMNSLIRAKQPGSDAPVRPT